MPTLTEARLRTVRDHMALESVQDWDAVIATFVHPHYELYGAGTVFDDIGVRILAMTESE